MKDDSTMLVPSQIVEAEALFIVELDDRHEMSPLIPPVNIYRCTVNTSCNTVAGCT